MNSNESFADVSAIRVRFACEQWKQLRSAEIKRRQEAEIDRLMAKRFFRPKSRNDARRLLAADGLYSEWGLIELHAGWAAHRVRRVQALAESGAETVRLCSEDALILSAQLQGTK